MSRVFIVQDNSRQNFTPAAKFGEIQTPFFPAHAQVYYETKEYINRVHDQLTAVGITADDYIILNGDPVLIGFIMTVSADYTDGHIKLLKYDRHEKAYVPIEVKDIFHRDGGT